jgi:hypothetical protein
VSSSIITSEFPSILTSPYLLVIFCCQQKTLSSKEKRVLCSFAMHNNHLSPSLFEMELELPPILKQPVGGRSQGQSLPSLLITYVIVNEQYIFCITHQAVISILHRTQEAPTAQCPLRLSQSCRLGAWCL